MRDFDYYKLAERTWDNEILSYVAQIHEHKGRQELFLRQKPVELTRLIEIAKIQSTESSNRIEGIITTDLLKYTFFSYGGSFMTTLNEIDMTLASGERVTLFRPLEPYETPDAVQNICDSFQKELALGEVDPLILIPCFILDFLCIHPFNDGNGRMSRLLTLLLLYRSGYIVGQYISIEKAIADTKENYYKVLAQADQDWHTGGNDPKPFIKYMLGIILGC